MGDASADPLAMLEFSGAGGEQVEEWRSKAEDLRVELEDLARGLGSVPSELSAGVTVRSAEDLAGRFEGLVAEQEHQDGYVRSVAEAVLTANGFDYVLTGDLPVTGEPLAWPDGVLTAPEHALNGVGHATLYESVAGDAALDAERGLELLTDAGLVDALDDGLGFDELQDSVHSIDSEGELALWLEEVGPRLEEDPLYAAAFYNALGPDGLHALAGLFLGAGGMAEINDGAGWEEAESLAPGGGEWVHHVGDPFINGLADATRTGYLDTAIFDSLLTFETENDRLAAAIMFSAEGDRYDGWTLGRIAQTILGEGHLEDNPNEYLTEADAFMMRALAENPDAAYWFVVDDAGEPVDEYLEMLLDPDQDLSYLANTAKGIENIWFNDQNLSTMYEFWMASGYYSLVPDEVAYEFRDFNGEAIEGHPWRDEEFWLGDPRFLEGQGYDGWYDPTEGDEHTLYTIWVGEPDSDLEPLAFFYDHRPDDLSMAIDLMPFLGQAKALYEVFQAEDPITGDEVNRWVALGGFALGATFWAAGVYPTGRALLSWTRRQVRNHPPLDHTTASSGLNGMVPYNWTNTHLSDGSPLQHADSVPSPGPMADDPLQGLSEADLELFKLDLADQLYRSSLGSQIADALPEGHPWKHFSDAELKDLIVEIVRRINRQANQLDDTTVVDSISSTLDRPMTQPGEFIEPGEYVPTWAEHYGIEGLSDWELYQVLEPISGEVYLPGVANTYSEGPVHLTDPSQAQNYSSYVWEGAPLSDADTDAIHFYTGSGYEDIHEYLRGDNPHPTPEVLQYIERIDHVISRQPVPHTVNVTRTIDLANASGMFPDIEDLSDLPVGYQVSEDGYLSTSLDTAFHFEKHNMDDPMVINLEVPPGTPAFGMEQRGRDLNNMGESELLLGRGLTWEVTSPPRLENGVWVIDAKIVPDSALTSTFRLDAPQFPNQKEDWWSGPSGDQDLVLSAMDEIGVNFDVNVPPTPTNRVDDFDKLLDAAPGNELKYVIREDGTIAFVPFSTPGQGELAHAGLTRGPDENVLGAGTITLTRNDDGTYDVVELTNNTGHYKVDASTLEDVVVPTLEQQGLTVDPDVITPFPGS